ncbi:dihydroxyacetone kinase phosphoryl donor subunit DhaM [Nakamurella lactea]|uniref:dihydroxyacetone kinase phosphoryl donor subunit DhaM n=1 Tax=Nakamurella lactea TaxID=459515 RepID=UPI0003FE7F66|nr:dihydroxyacetone kinase phosphoryl donor subunit DhaM [Nakamurella lactea]
MTVALVLVSHSHDIADGTAKVAAQMAPSVTIAAAGGDGRGGIGTSYDRISDALRRTDQADGTVILYDLGSALMTTEMAVEGLDGAAAGRCRIVDAPLVEGAIAAAVAAEGGADLAAVAAAAAAAGYTTDAGPADDDSRTGAAPATGEAQVVLVNPLGLHARPAAELARHLAGTSATVRIGRSDGPTVDLRSVLGVVGLALRGGDTVRIAVWGEDADAVLERLTATISGGFGEAGDGGEADDGGPLADADRPPGPDADGTVLAVPGSAGLALGPLYRLTALPDELPAGADRIVGDAGRATQRARLDSAIGSAAKQLAGQGEFGQAHAALVADPQLREAAYARLDRGATRAWWETVGAAAKELQASSDALIAARAIDLKEAGLVVLAELGLRLDRIGDAVRGAIVVAAELGPAEVPALVERGAVAAVLTGSSTTAHAVIVARGLGLPLVLRAGEALNRVPTGTALAIDGATGAVRVDPPTAELEEIADRIDRNAAADAALRAAAAAPVSTRDGRPVLVAANIGSVADARAAVANGADGVGLLRTELLLLDRPEFPDEDTQTADLAAILNVLGRRPVVIRVVDAGGDKPIPSVSVTPEHNGFLGIRGLRLLLERPAMLRTQLRAICRAAAGHRVSVMAPMVTVRAEAVAFRQAVDDAVDSLVAEGIEHAAPEQIGIMIEIPAAALYAEQFVGIADFFSVGSNDLTSYTMAAERTEPGVADLLDVGAPPVQRLLDTLCETARRHHVPVTVCGEMAAMAEQVKALVDRGVVELSMAPARIPQIKALVAGL